MQSLLDMAERADGELVIRLHRPFSRAEVEEWGEGIKPFRLEVLPDQTLLVMSPVSARFSPINLRLGALLLLWSDADGTGTAFDSSAGFDLPDGSNRSPDAAWVLNQRLLLSEWADRAYYPVCPDFVVELRSPSDRLEGQSPAALFRKMDAWMLNGARLAWLIDPIDEQAYVYRPGLPVELVASFDSILTGEAVLPGFELPLSRLRLPA